MKNNQERNKKANRLDPQEVKRIERSTPFIKTGHLQAAGDD